MNAEQKLVGLRFVTIFVAGLSIVTSSARSLAPNMPIERMAPHVGSRRHQMNMRAWLLAGLVLVGIGSEDGARATSTFCAVPERTTDGFLNLRTGPEHNILSLAGLCPRITFL